MREAGEGGVVGKVGGEGGVVGKVGKGFMLLSSFSKLLLHLSNTFNQLSFAIAEFFLEVVKNYFRFLLLLSRVLRPNLYV